MALYLAGSNYWEMLKNHVVSLGYLKSIEPGLQSGGYLGSVELG